MTHRRVLVAVAVVLLLAADVAAFPETGSIRRSFPQVDIRGAEPWIDSPSPPPRGLVALPPPPAPPSNAPQCTASQVKAEEAAASGLAGSILFDVSITNMSPSVCSLKGVPSFVAKVVPGRPAQRIAANVEPEFLPVWASNLAPGTSGVEQIRSSHSCDPRGPVPMFETLEIGLPVGGSVLASQGSARAPFQFPCGAGLSPLGVVKPMTRYAPEPLEGTKSSIVAPASVPAGSLLTYVVVLRNPTAKPISLRSCDGYREVLAGAGPNPVVETHALNCVGVTSLPSQGNHRFIMKIRAPDLKVTRNVTLVWIANYPGSFELDQPFTHVEIVATH